MEIVTSRGLRLKHFLVWLNIAVLSYETFLVDFPPTYVTLLTRGKQSQNE